MTEDDEAPRAGIERKVRTLRLAGALVLATLFAELLSSAALFERLPAWSPALLAWSPASSWTTLAFLVFLALAALPAFVEERPLPAWVGLHAAVLGFALYGWSNIDWTLVAFDAEAAAGGLPGPVVLVGAVAPLVVAVGLHAAEERLRFEEQAATKGLPPEEARVLADAAGPAARRVLALAVGLWALVALAFFALVAAAPLVRPLAAAAPAVVPVAAAVLVLATLALVARRAREGRA